MKIKPWLIAALGLILCGGILFGGIMMALHWDFTKLSTVTYETNTHAPGSDFTGIVVETDTANILFAPTDEDCSVTCVEDIRGKHAVYVDDGTLYIINNSTRNWYDHIGIQIGSPKITIHLPQKQYDALTVKATTGDVTLAKGMYFHTASIKVTTGRISLSDISSRNITLQTNTGMAELTGVVCEDSLGILVGTGQVIAKVVRCNELVTTSGTGDIDLIDVVARERFTISGGTSSVNFSVCDAQEINVSTATGNVWGTLRSGKTFDIETETGKVHVPENSGHGTCHIRTKTGDIHITVE